MRVVWDFGIMKLMTRYGTMYRQGDIVLIPVPFSDLKSNKQRPVLIISRDEYNEISDDIVVLAITSKIRHHTYSIVIESNDLSEGELKVTSEIRVDKIYTLSKNIVKKKFGKVSTDVLEVARMKINKLIK